MKKLGILVVIVLVSMLLLTVILFGENRDDIQAIKKAVKENPSYEAGKEVKWFKILVTDNKTNKDRVRVTLPISIVEVFLRCAEDKHLKMDQGRCDIDLGQVFKELKALGPMALIEVYENGERVKIWLE